MARWPRPLVPCSPAGPGPCASQGDCYHQPHVRQLHFGKPPQALAHRTAGNRAALGPHERRSWKTSPPSPSPPPLELCAALGWAQGALEGAGAGVSWLSLPQPVRKQLRPPAVPFCPPPRESKMLGEGKAADRGPQVPAPSPAMLPPRSRPLTEEEGGGRRPWGPGCNTCPCICSQGRGIPVCPRPPPWAPATSAPYSSSGPQSSLRRRKCPLSVPSTVAAPATVAVSSRNTATPTEERNSASFNFH